jgi:hypothetical protein
MKGGGRGGAAAAGIAKKRYGRWVWWAWDIEGSIAGSGSRYGTSISVDGRHGE